MKTFILTYGLTGILTVAVLIFFATVVAQDRAARREHRLRQQSLKYQQMDEADDGS